MNENQQRRITLVIAEQLWLNPEKVKPESRIVDDLGADSLDEIELVMALEDEFGIQIADELANKVATVQDAFNLIAQLVPEAA